LIEHMYDGNRFEVLAEAVNELVVSPTPGGRGGDPVCRQGVPVEK
jgi:hypothetical protein